MRSVMVHGVLAALGLLAAFWVWSAGDGVTRPAEAVTMQSCSAGELQSVTLTTKKKTVQVALAGGSEAGSWITVTTPNATTPTKLDVDRFAASEKISRVTEKLAPLSAERSLGEVDDKKLAELGLDKAEDRLALKCGGQERAFKLGKKTYGGRTRYAQSTDGGAVHLLANALVSDLEMAEFRFMQRDLVRFRLDEVERVTVTAQGKTRQLLHRNRADRAKAMWVAADAPDRRNEQYGNWLGKVFRLRALDYLKRGQQPGAEASKQIGKTVAPSAVVTLDFEGSGRDRVELQRIVRAKPSDTTFYARSKATGGWVTVPSSLGQQVADDVAAILGLEEPEAAAPAAPATPTNAAK